MMVTSVEMVKVSHDGGEGIAIERFANRENRTYCFLTSNHCRFFLTVDETSKLTEIPR